MNYSCPNPSCKNSHFVYEEVDLEPKSLPMYAVFCSKCNKFITFHEKGIADLLTEIKKKLDLLEN